jgi:hypothetical protein
VVEQLPNHGEDLRPSTAAHKRTSALEGVDGGYRAIWMVVRRAGVLYWLAANNERPRFCGRRGCDVAQTCMESWHGEIEPTDFWKPPNR